MPATARIAAALRAIKDLLRFCPMQKLYIELFEPTLCDRMVARKAVSRSWVRYVCFGSNADITG